jgi:putative spermidine/putrescine transport system permease protein
MTPTSGAKSASLTTYLQVVPLALVLFVFFLVPVALVTVVSFFRYQMLVGIVPDFSSATISLCSPIRPPGPSTSRP